jgi:integrase
MTIVANEIRGFTCPDDKKQIKKYDSKGLYLLIKPNNSKLWRFRYIYGGKSKELALGKYPSIQLTIARELAEKARILLGQGINPMAERKAKKRASSFSDKAFGNIALLWWEKQYDSWTKDHALRVKRWLTIDSKSLGPISVDEIDVGHITDLMLEIESLGSSKKATVILPVINRVFGYAVAHRLTRNNPAQGLPLRDIIKPIAKIRSFSAIVKPSELGKLIFDIDMIQSGTYCTVEALKLIPRIFIRPNEVRELKWDFIDFDEKLIRIPADQMKSDRDHLVPLAKQVIEQLKQIKEITGYSPYIFPGQRNSNNPISKNVMTNRLRSLGYTGDVMTTHGFRSTASTILHEKGYDHEVIETQLAHLTGTATSRAYNRSKHLPKRRKMMQDWANYLEELKTKDIASF